MQETEKQVPNVESRLDVAFRLIDEEFDAGLSQGFDTDGMAEHQRNSFKTLLAHGHISFDDVSQIIADMRNARKRANYKGPGNATPKSEIEYQMWKDDYYKREEAMLADMRALQEVLFGSIRSEPIH